MIKILITGHRGLLGSALAKTLTGKNFKIYGLDLPNDISQKTTIEKIAAALPDLDWIAHTAALVNVDKCQTEKKLCYKVNVEGTRNIRWLAEKTKAGLIYLSTAAVFSGLEGDYKENSVPYPQNFYSLTKLLGEEAVLSYSQGIVLRVNLIGLHPDKERSANFLEWLYYSLKNNQDIKLVSDVKTNPLTNWGLARLIKQIIILKPKEKIIHLASQEVLSKAAIGRLVLKHFPDYQGKIELVKSDQLFLKTKRPTKMWLNSQLAQKKLGLKMPFIKQDIDQAFQLKKKKQLGLKAKGVLYLN